VLIRPVLATVLIGGAFAGSFLAARTLPTEPAGATQARGAVTISVAAPRVTGMPRRAYSLPRLRPPRERVIAPQARRSPVPQPTPVGPSPPSPSPSPPAPAPAPAPAPEPAATPSAGEFSGSN
jgi:hypothetical protein